MSHNDRYVIVEGSSSSNTPIRPHNWAERFAGNLASYDRHLRLSFSSLLVPVMFNDAKGLRMDRSLRHSHPEIYRDILGFAAAHGLVIHGLEAPMELPLAS
jgi:hypothetical protein